MKVVLRSRINYHRVIKQKMHATLFGSNGYSRIRARKHHSVIGDSYVNVFKHIFITRVGPKDGRINYLRVGGVTALGILNPKPFQHIMDELGEVDCGFVIRYYVEIFRASLRSDYKGCWITTLYS